MKSFSWHLTDDGRLIKELDYSSFHHKETGIPRDFYDFFGITSTFAGNEINLHDKDSKNNFLIAITLSRPSAPLLKLSWKEDFGKYLKKNFKNWSSVKPNQKITEMKLVLKKLTDYKYMFYFLDESDLENNLINFEKKVSSELSKPIIVKPKGIAKPSRKKQYSYTILRDAKVKAWILKNSSGNCEACGKKAPFQKDNGEPYLEVHHLKRLSDGGSDTISNAIAVCPNCHRNLHLGSEKNNLEKKIYEKIKRLIPE